MIKLNEVVQCVIATAIVVLSFQFSQWNVGLNLWDEGYLWYGVQQVMIGAVPLRDFMAYDPGRYYLYSTLMLSLGSDGIASFRIAGAFIQFITVLLALILISLASKKTNFLYKILCVITLVVWMYARHRYIDITMSIILVSALAYCISRNNIRSIFFTGLVIGFVALFGRNHGFYGLVGFAITIIYLYLTSIGEFKLMQKMVAAFIGLAIGFSPCLYMFVVVPDYHVAFLESMRFLLEINSTNLTLPVPWPWTLSSYFSRQAFVGLFFIYYIFFIFLGIIYLAKNRGRRVSSVLVASIIMSIPYIHYALSRADLDHLTISFFPVLIGSFVLINGLSGYRKFLGSLFLSGSSIFVLIIYQPGWYCFKNPECAQVSVTETMLLVDGTTANDILLLKKLVAKYADNSKGFLITPYWPGAYAVLRAKSPIWEIYALFPRGDSFEVDEIERLKEANIGFVFVLDHALDGRDDLRYRNTHSLIYNYVLNNFNKVNESDVPYYYIFKSK